MIVGRVAQHTRFRLEFESGALDVTFRERLVDAVQILCRGVTGAGQCGVIDDGEDPARLERLADSLEEVIVVGRRPEI